MKTQDQIIRTYNDINVDDSDDDNPVDSSGYTGELFRKK
jgi:hypothetical protein